MYMSSDLEEMADYIVKQIIEDRKKLREWRPDESYFRVMAQTERHMKEALLLGQKVREKLKALGEL
jgi:hypothetical protein